MKDTYTYTESFYQNLAELINSRQRLLTSDGLLGIGQEIGADTLELFVRIPGHINPNFLLIGWNKHAKSIEPKAIPLQQLNNTVIEKVLNTGKEIIWNNGSGFKSDSYGSSIGKDESVGSLAALPLLFHGSVIGCMCVKSSYQNKFDPQILTKLRNHALIISLVAHGEIELHVAHGFSSKIIQWRMRKEISTISDDIQAISEILLNELSAAAVVIHFDIGFKSFIQVAGNIDEAETIRNAVADDLPTVMKRLGESMEIIERDLLDVAEVQDEARITVGKLYVVVSKNKDTILTHGSSYSLAPTLATLTTEAVLNATRDRLNNLVKELGINLNSETLISNEQWFYTIENIAEKTQLGWTVATIPDDDRQYGNQEAVKIVEACKGKITHKSDHIELIKLDDPDLGKHVVLSIHLPNTGARIWFGVRREDYGDEMSVLSPWQVFLDRVSQMTDSALLRLRLQRLQMEAAETRNLATYLVMSHTVFHQVSNMVRDIVNPISTIKEAVNVGDLKANDSIIDLIKLSNQSATKLLDFTFTFMNVDKMDTRRPCALDEAVNESKGLFAFSLKSNQIQLHIDVPKDLSIDVPFNVAFMAIANVLSNAKDAIGKCGNITIRAENTADFVRCYIINDGPPIDPQIRDRIFQLGTTTKFGHNARGWGLYLVYRSLIENRGYIELSSSVTGETIFTLQFPHIR